MAKEIIKAVPDPKNLQPGSSRRVDEGIKGDRETLWTGASSEGEHFRGLLRVGGRAPVYGIATLPLANSLSYGPGFGQVVAGSSGKRAQDGSHMDPGDREWLPRTDRSLHEVVEASEVPGCEENKDLARGLKITRKLRVCCSSAHGLISLNQHIWRQQRKFALSTLKSIAVRFEEKVHKESWYLVEIAEEEKGVPENPLRWHFGNAVSLEPALPGSARLAPSQNRAEGHRAGSHPAAPCGRSLGKTLPVLLWRLCAHDLGWELGKGGRRESTATGSRQPSAGFESQTKPGFTGLLAPAPTFLVLVLQRGKLRSPGRGDAGGQPFDPHYKINSAVSTIICSVTFGNRFDYCDNHFQDLLQSLAETLLLTASFWGHLYNAFPLVMRWLPGPFRKIFRHWEKLKNFVKRVIAKHKEDLNQSESGDDIDCHLREINRKGKWKGDTSSYFHEENLLCSTLDLFLTGTETTATAIRWALLYMAMYRHVQDFDLEGNQPAGSYPDIPMTWKIGAIQTDTLFFSQSPVLPHLSQGTTLMTSLTPVMFDKNVWETPDTFNPEHFLEKGQYRKREAFLPFSAGKRACPGEQLARTELFIFFTALLQKFTFRAPAHTALTLEFTLSLTHCPKSFQIRALLSEARGCPGFLALHPFAMGRRSLSPTSLLHFWMRWWSPDAQGPAAHWTSWTGMCTPWD
nr:PREDICTED: cytochrome P450 2J6-like [Apteryx mantelli mantelli]